MADLLIVTAMLFYVNTWQVVWRSWTDCEVFVTPTVNKTTER